MIHKVPDLVRVVANLEPLGDMLATDVVDDLNILQIECGVVAQSERPVAVGAMKYAPYAVRGRVS